MAYPAEGHDAVLQALAARVSPRVLRAPRRLDAAAREIDEYFAGRRRAFDLPLDLRLSTGFRRKRAHPPARHRLRAYRQLRHGSGRRGQPPGVPRRRHGVRDQPAAGRAALPPGDQVRRDLGGYAGGPAVKRFLLKLEAA